MASKFMGSTSMAEALMGAKTLKIWAGRNARHSKQKGIAVPRHALAAPDDS